MFRVVSRLLILISVILGLFSLTAGIVGAMISAYVVTYVTTQDHTALDPTLEFNLLDLKRDLTVKLNTPVEGIRAAELQDVQSALILTRQNFPETQISRIRLLRYDLSRGTVSPVYEADRSGGARYQINDIQQDLSPRYSPDNTHLALYDAAIKQVIVHDLESGQEIARLEIDFNVQNGSFIIYAWSPDSQQIAIGTSTDHLVIMNRDGSNRREFEIGNDFGYEVSWSTDSRQLLISQFNIQKTPLRLLNVETMTLSPRVAKQQGSAAAWACDGQYIVYRWQLMTGRTQLRLLNPQTGRVTKINMSGDLVDSSLTGLSTTASCTWAVAVENDAMTIAPSGGSFSNFVQITTFTTYLLNLQSGESRFLARDIVDYQFDPSDETSVIYTRAFEDGAYGIFRVNFSDRTAGTRIHHYRPFLSGFGRLQWISPQTALQLLTPESMGRLYLYDDGELHLISRSNEDVREYAYGRFRTS